VPAAATTNYWLNVLQLLGGGRMLRPLVVTYYLTTRCNLNCAYCEDFGARRNPQAMPPLPLAEALHILEVIRTASDHLILTGGEPLLHPEIEALVRHARRLGFHVTLQTNAALLHEHPQVLPYINRLVVSLDTLDGDRWGQLLNAPAAVVAQIMENIRTCAAAQRRHGYRMVLNCVLTPHTLDEAPAILDFCRRHNLLVSFSPQAVQNWPDYYLLVSPAYRALLQRLLDEKQRRGPVLGSRAYLRTLLDFRPYACYPTLAPRVLPNGDCIYPCRPVEKEDNGHGGRPCNLLQVRHWREVNAAALAAYGQPPVLCTSCFQQCFAETSLLQAQPLSWLSEWLRHPASRQAHLFTYAPG